MRFSHQRFRCWGGISPAAALCHTLVLPPAVTLLSNSCGVLLDALIGQRDFFQQTFLIEVCCKSSHFSGGVATDSSRFEPSMTNLNKMSHAKRKTHSVPQTVRNQVLLAFFNVNTFFIIRNLSSFTFSISAAILWACYCEWVAVPTCHHSRHWHQSLPLVDHAMLCLKHDSTAFNTLPRHE